MRVRGGIHGGQEGGRGWRRGRLEARREPNWINETETGVDLVMSHHLI